MADIYPIKRKWGKQKPPLGTPLNRAHPLVKDLIGCFLFNERTGDILYNAIDNKPATLQTIGTGGTADWYPKGYDYGVGGANSKWWSVDPEIFQGLGTTDYTLMWGAYCDTIPVNVYATALCFNDYDPQWGVGADGFLHIYDGTTTYTGITNVENSDVNLTLVRKGLGVTDCSGYINGVLDKHAQHPYSLINPTTVRIGYDNYSAESWYGTMYYLYFWKRALTPEEVKSLHANPYQMFDRIEYIDVSVETTQTISTTLDSLIQETGITKTTTLDALLNTSFSKVVTLDALVNATILKTTSLDALLNKSGLTESTTLDALIRKTLTEIITLDALISKTNLTEIITLDALVQKLFTEITTLDALITKSDNVISSTLDAILFAGTLVTTTLDALLNKSGLTKTTALDALVQETDLTISATIDALIFKSKTILTTLDAIIIGAISITTVLDALLNATGLTKTLIIDAILILTGQETRYDFVTTIEKPSFVTTIEKPSFVTTIEKPSFKIIL